MFGPLVLGYKGDHPIRIKTGASILPTGENEFTVEGTDFKLTPLYHLLDKNVNEKIYRRQVLF
jgi:hypothetical protein